MRITLDQVLNALQPGQGLVGGAVSDSVRREVESRGMTIHDYLRREELAISNAVPPAEGAVQLAMEELPITICGARCLITGYGRVAQALARLLAAMRADVTVAFGPGGVHRGVALDLYEEGRNLAGMTVTAPELALPGECEEQLLAALWEQGGLKREKLRVKWSAKGVSPLTNGDKANIIP